MTVAELIIKLQAMDQYLPVAIVSDDNDGFSHSKQINFVHTAHELEDGEIIFIEEEELIDQNVVVIG